MDGWFCFYFRNCNYCKTHPNMCPPQLGCNIVLWPKNIGLLNENFIPCHDLYFTSPIYWKCLRLPKFVSLVQRIVRVHVLNYKNYEKYGDVRFDSFHSKIFPKLVCVMLKALFASNSLKKWLVLKWGHLRPIISVEGLTEANQKHC